MYYAMCTVVTVIIILLCVTRQESLRLVLSTGTLSTGLVELVVIIILSQNVKHPFMAGAFVTV